MLGLDLYSYALSVGRATPLVIYAQTSVGFLKFYAQQINRRTYKARAEPNCLKLFNQPINSNLGGNKLQEKQQSRGVNVKKAKKINEG